MSMKQLRRLLIELPEARYWGLLVTLIVICLSVAIVRLI